MEKSRGRKRVNDSINIKENGENDIILSMIERLPQTNYAALVAFEDSMPDGARSLFFKRIFSPNPWRQTRFSHQNADFLSVWFLLHYVPGRAFKMLASRDKRQALEIIFEDSPFKEKGLLFLQAYHPRIEIRCLSRHSDLPGKTTRDIPFQIVLSWEPCRDSESTPTLTNPSKGDVSHKVISQVLENSLVVCLVFLEKTNLWAASPLFSRVYRSCCFKFAWVLSCMLCV